VRRLTTRGREWPKVIPPAEWPISLAPGHPKAWPVRLAPGREKLARESTAWLIEWLNGTQRVKSPGDRRRITNLIKRLQALSREAAKLVQQHTYDDFIRQRAKMDKAWHAVNAITYERYDILQGFCPTGARRNGGGQYIAAVDERFGFLSDDEYRAYLTVRELVRLESFDRLTQCAECRVKWIFRRRKNQQHCSERCRQKHYENSPERKKQRREYMREYQRKLRKAQSNGKR
jgi:hypothetical protein